MSVIRFEAEPYAIGSWIIIKLLQSASQKLPSRGQVMVNGLINGFQFQSALEPDGKSGHWFQVSDTLRKSANIDVGKSVPMEIEPTKDWPEPVVPADWQSTLDGDRKIQALWMAVTPMARWEWLRWIGSTSQPLTRQRRIEVSCSKLLAGERRPCCFNRNMCCIPEVSKNGVLLEPTATSA